MRERKGEHLYKRQGREDSRRPMRERKEVRLQVRRGGPLCSQNKAGMLGVSIRKRERKEYKADRQMWQDGSDRLMCQNRIMIIIR
jgi:hypothetical protein